MESEKEYRRSTADKLGDILEVKLLLFEKSMEAFQGDFRAVNKSLLNKIDQNREIMTIMLDEVNNKLEIQNKHLATLNGSVSANKDDITVLKQNQRGYERLRKGIWWFIGAITTAGLFVIGMIILNNL